MAGRGWKAHLKKRLRSLGLELQRYDLDGTYSKRRRRQLESERVDLVLDVGAHAGEFAQALRHGGYEGKIVSFEPIREHYERLEALAKADRDWSCQRTAIGDHSGEIEIYISGNDGFSSSVREMASAHETADPSSSYVGSEMVEVTTLDRLQGEILDPESRAFLKVDTQGFESEVLAGATEVLRSCRLVELELGFVELYKDQVLFQELVQRAHDAGFALTDLEPGFRDSRTKELLQMDALFIRSEIRGCQG